MVNGENVCVLFYKGNTEDTEVRKIVIPVSSQPLVPLGGYLRVKFLRENHHQCVN